MGTMFLQDPGPDQALWESARRGTTEPLGAAATGVAFAGREGRGE